METIIIDAPEVTRDAAVEHMVHHLQLAAMYFEAVPESYDDVRDEMLRLIKNDDRSIGPALAWFSHIHKYYEDMKERD